MFIKKRTIQVGDTVISTKNIDLGYGVFMKGTIFTVTGECNRGYDLVDTEGNRVCETHYSSVRLFEIPGDSEYAKNIAEQINKVLKAIGTGKTVNTQTMVELNENLQKYNKYVSAKAK